MSVADLSGAADRADLRSNWPVGSQDVAARPIGLIGTTQEDGWAAVVGASVPVSFTHNLFRPIIDPTIPLAVDQSAGQTTYPTSNSRRPTLRPLRDGLWLQVWLVCVSLAVNAIILAQLCARKLLAVAHFLYFTLHRFFPALVPLHF